MIGNIPMPTDRASFDSAIATVLSEHATLRHLAAMASEGANFSADDALSLANAVTSHEHAEDRLFELPFLTRTPASVISTGARLHHICVDYTSGKNSRHPNSRTAATLLSDALLAHIAAEEVWLAHEKELHHERLLKSI